MRGLIARAAAERLMRGVGAILTLRKPSRGVASPCGRP
jgi:hypothetical protein